jgi:hypothetical protein
MPPLPADPVTTQPRRPHTGGIFGELPEGHRREDPNEEEFCGRTPTGVAGSAWRR